MGFSWDGKKGIIRRGAGRLVRLLLILLLAAPLAVVGPLPTMHEVGGVKERRSRLGSMSYGCQQSLASNHRRRLPRLNPPSGIVQPRTQRQKDGACLRLAKPHLPKLIKGDRAVWLASSKSMLSADAPPPPPLSTFHTLVPRTYTSAHTHAPLTWP